MQAVGSWGLSPHWALVRPVQLGKDRDTRTRTRARPLGHTFPNTPSCAPNPQPQQSIIPSSPKQNKSCTAAFPDAPASCSPCPGTGATSSGRTVELPGGVWGRALRPPPGPLGLRGARVLSQHWPAFSASPFSSPWPSPASLSSFLSGCGIPHQPRGSHPPILTPGIISLLTSAPTPGNVAPSGRDCVGSSTWCGI